MLLGHLDIFGQTAQAMAVTVCQWSCPESSAGLSCLTGSIRHKLSSPLQMIYRGNDEQLSAVNLENMLRGISDDSAVAGELAIFNQITSVQIESPKTANRIKSPTVSGQIESFRA